MSTIWPVLTFISGHKAKIMTLHLPRPLLASFTDQFAPIGLPALNDKAAMMARIDNKYVIRRATLDQIAPALTAYFDVLEIDQRRAFTYDTRYFDDAGHSSYYEHQRGMRRLFKVRARRYVEANLAYLEVKLKGLRGLTLKHRMALDMIPETRLAPASYAFARDTYSTHYNKDFAYDLRSSLNNRYQRITLVAKSGGERMTIDTGLTYRNQAGFLDVGPDVFIVETKSALGRGLADKVLRQIHVRPVKGCSKYCIGVAALGDVARFNHFLPTLRKLGIADQTLQHCPVSIMAAA